MDIKFTNDDFRRLNKIRSINHNKKLFNKSKGYTSKKGKQIVADIQQPVLVKMGNLLNAISNEPYFNKRFEITLCKRRKLSTKTTQGPYRPLLWISLVPNSEVSNLGSANYKHQKLPQLQISLKSDKLIIASIWLEGRACEQEYRLQLFDYLYKHKLQSKYIVTIDNKTDKDEDYHQRFEKYSEKILIKAKKNKYFSIGVERKLDKDKVVKEGEKIYQLILNETEELYKKIFLPCFGLKDIKQEKQKATTKGRYTRKGTTSDKISKYYQGLIPPRVITPKHKIIQKHLKKWLEIEYKWVGKVHKEKNYVDLSVEYIGNDKAILFEIKTATNTLNCLKQGLGQLLFYSLITKEFEKRSIELVIVGLHKIKSEEERKFVRLLKKIMDKTKFRYQMWDEKEKELLDESKS